MDEFSQPDAEESFESDGKKKASRRGTKGNRAAQARRYYLKNRSKLLRDAKVRMAKLKLFKQRHPERFDL